MTAPEPITLPPLPLAYEYVYGWNGGHRSLSSNRWNGMPPDTSETVYTADQMRTYAAAFALECDRSRALADASQASEAWRTALKRIASSKPRYEAASKLDGSPERLRCWHCGHAWQVGMSPHHDPDCAYVEAMTALATTAPTVVPDASKAVVGEASDYVSVLEYSAEDIVAEWGKGFESGFDSGKKHGAKRAALTHSPAPSAAPQGADALREALAWKWGYEYLQSRMESIGRNGWAHDCDDEINFRIGVAQ